MSCDDSDLENVGHTAFVTADTLYEAIALGLKAFRGSAWTSGIREGMEPIKVCVMDIPVEHTVTVKDFTRWLTRESGSPEIG